MFVIGQDRRIKLTLTYPASTGRNFAELLRAIDSLQLTAQHQVATPVNWQPGEEVIIVPAVSDAMARERDPRGWRAPRPYLRYVPAPAPGPSLNECGIAGGVVARWIDRSVVARVALIA